MYFEIIYEDRHCEIETDRNVVFSMIDDLESGDRTDIAIISYIEDDGTEDEMWTKEEGLIIR